MLIFESNLYMKRWPMRVMKIKLVTSHCFTALIFKFSYGDLPIITALPGSRIDCLTTRKCIIIFNLGGQH